jgi:hypothetical protein
MNRTLNSLQKIKFNPLVNRIIFEQGKKKYLLNRFNLNPVNKYKFKPVIIRKYTTSSNNQPNNDDNQPPDDERCRHFMGLGVLLVILTDPK